VFYFTYLLSELLRRKERTLLTALGLAVGVGLVVTSPPSPTASTTPS
jgi:hypothetical protein